MCVFKIGRKNGEGAINFTILKLSRIYLRGIRIRMPLACIIKSKAINQYGMIFICYEIDCKYSDWLDQCLLSNIHVSFIIIVRICIRLRSR